MDSELFAKRQTLIGLFIVSLATLMLEILLTRIFSVTMQYHFAFMAVSIAMFGMTQGGVLVYLFPDFFIRERAKYHLALSALLCGISIVGSFLIHLAIPTSIFNSIIKNFCLLTLTYIVISIPFIFSGICACIAITKFPKQVSTLYAANLAGAACGCILLLLVLNITDGPTVVIVIASLACLASAFFASELSQRRLMLTSIIIGILFSSFAVFNSILVNRQSPWLRIKWVKGKPETTSYLFERWNSFSRIRVTGNPYIPREIFAWGLSPVYAGNCKEKRLTMAIDATAGTTLTFFDGNLDDVEYLKYDITNLVHYLRKNAKVLIIGVGGGRDILSALVFGQKSVLGIEVNKNIIDAVNRAFGDFTGHLDRNPKVTFINDEARSYIARSKDKFDIIQAALTDTWAATATGAYVLTENSLYTVEAWKMFLEHLSPQGILTFSRWYTQDIPGEIYRLTSLANASLRQLGISQTRDHIIIVRRMKGKAKYREDGIGTILVSKEPFSKEEVDVLTEIVNKMKFELVLSPTFSIDSTFADIASAKDIYKFAARFPINIAPPTDDSPFFFNMLKFNGLIKGDFWKQETMLHNVGAVFVLWILQFTVIALTVLCIIIPFMLKNRNISLPGALSFSIFFAGIGLGFMLVEISTMQRLIIFLGHPTYALSVALFTLLLSSGIGSYLTYKITNSGLISSGTTRLFLLLCVLSISGIFIQKIISALQAATTMLRIFTAIGLLFPLGLCMGMAFPLGMRRTAIKFAALSPWLWGINGATSVCASVLAVVVALNSGISTSFWLGCGCYVVSFIAFLKMPR